MARRVRGPLEDEDDSASKPTSLEMRSPFAPPPAGKPDDSTMQLGSGYRLAPTVQGFRLVDDATGKKVSVEQGVAEIGSDPSNDLVVEHATVSRFHCEVKIEDQRLVVKDLGSTNGTFVENVRVKDGYLREGQRLKLGQAVVRLELVDRHHAIEVSQESSFGELVGFSAAMRIAFATLEKAAKTDSTIIIEGETGTGKSRAAQAMHEKSARAAKPFLVVDCGAMPPALLEAELFGHEKGAFTGAATRRLGVFEEAAGGTVLLDEIGELPLELQPRLLRVLEDRQIRRLGQNQWTKVDVRILAATHRDLRADVNSGKFRQDLYFRLAVARVRLPSLREHPEDLEQVATALLERLGASKKTHPGLYARSFFEQLKTAAWPGNVRELRNYLERCLLFEEAVPLQQDDVSPKGKEAAPVLGGPLSDARQKAIDAFERTYLAKLLERHGGKVSQAAVEAEVDRVYLYRLLRKHGMKAR